MPLGGYFYLEVPGFSMFPTLKLGDNVLVKPSLAEQIQERDIIVNDELTSGIK